MVHYVATIVIAEKDNRLNLRQVDDFDYQMRADGKWMPNLDAVLQQVDRVKEQPTARVVGSMNN